MGYRLWRRRGMGTIAPRARAGGLRMAVPARPSPADRRGSRVPGGTPRPLAENLAAVRELAASLARELRGPVSQVNSGLRMVEAYVRDFLEIASAYEQLEYRAGGAQPELDDIRRLKRVRDFDYLRHDVLRRLEDSNGELSRVARIVRDLADFSRRHGIPCQWTDLHPCLDAALAAVRGEWGGACAVSRDYGVLPLVLCSPADLGRAFMCLLLHARQALPGPADLSIRTGCDGHGVFVAIAGAVQTAADDAAWRSSPLFAMPPGEAGSTLTLALADCIVHSHQGRIDVRRTPGRGASFTVRLPRDGRPHPGGPARRAAGKTILPATGESA